MFPNRKDVYFERRIHEQVMLSALRTGLQLVETTVVVEHHGYVETGKIREKAERNVRLLLAECESESPDVVRAIEIADSFFNLANFPDAQKWYDTVLSLPQCEKQFPDIASQAYLGLGNIKNQNAKFTDAIDCFTKALVLCPNRPDVQFSLAVAQDLSGNLAGAAETLRSILMAPPDTLKVSIDFREAKIKAYLRLERILLDLGKKDDLLTIAHEAEKSLAHRPEILAMAGRVYFVNKLYAESLHAFEKSLELNINQNYESYIGLCHIYCLAGKPEHAIATMKNIRELFGTRPAFWAYWIKLFDEPATKDIPADIDMKELEKEKRNMEKIYGR
jgi:tetratricopeptide (TPR) repeat protein